MIYLDYPTELPENARNLKTGLLDGSPAWSNGHVMFIGLSPLPDESDALPQDRFQKGIDNSDPGNMPEIFPVVCKYWMGRYCVNFWGSAAVINEWYFRMALERFPDAKFFSDGIHQIRVESSGVRVGLICRIDQKGEDVPEDVRVVLQSANAGPAQPTNESLEERQQQNEKT